MATRPSLLASRSVVSGITTPLTLLGNVTSLALVVSDNMSSAAHDHLGDASNNISSALVTTAASTNTTENPSTLPHPVWLTVILGLLAGIVMILTVLGNITVLLAFGLERTIRQPTNFFLASLAVSDLLIGTFSMPLYTQYLLFDVWPLGPWLCDLWLSLDWTVCLTSQYTVFLITMDRYLSVKIPAKYRNWRTEGKVLVMISVTWVLPTVVFFTSIIGWQYFIGKRTVQDGQCEVQFMDDAMFIFLLTIGYFWITLFVIGILYGGIYKVALDLQKKSDAKHKKLQSTMELAGDGSNHALRGATAQALEGSNNNSSGGESGSSKQNSKSNKSGGKMNSKKSVRAALPCPAGAAVVNTTSFSTKNAEKDDDRSSSPAFASDDENSSSGGAAGAPKSPLSSGVYIGRPNPAAGIANSALFANTGGLVRSLHGDLFFGGAVEKGDGPAGLKPPPPSYSQVMGKSGSEGSDLEDSAGAVRRNEADDGMYYSSTSDRMEKQTTPLLQDEINKGSRYIDEKSFMANINSESIALLPDLSKDASEVTEGDLNHVQATASPIWKRRLSLPLATQDEYDVDEEIGDYMTGDPATTFTHVGDGTALSRHGTVDDKGQQLPPTGNGENHDQDRGMYDRNNPCGDAAATTVVPVDGSDATAPYNLCSNNNSGAPPPNALATDSGDASKTNNNSAGPNATSFNNNAIPSDANEESSRSDTHCLSAHRRRNKDTRLHTFVKSVRSRNSRRRNRRERKSKSENRARKALRTITIILGAFVLCWTPYHICVMVMALCKNCVNGYLYSFTYWLCYLNSPINPFCYAFANTQFKRTFLRIMKFDWHRT